MAYQRILSPEEIRQLVEYDAATGLFRFKWRDASWFSALGDAGAKRAQKIYNTGHAGQPAFTTLRDDGYLCGTLFGRKYLAHRVALAITTSEWPLIADHVNGVRTDNRASNLRAVGHHENSRNSRKHRSNTSGTPRVYWDGARRKWVAEAWVGGKKKHLGRFEHMNDAADARKKAIEEIGGYTARHGI
jgi:hypothetical protein